MNLLTVNESQVRRLSIKGLISSYLNSHYGLWTHNMNQLKYINKKCYFTVWNTLNDNVLCKKTGIIHYWKKGNGMPFQMPGQMKKMTRHHKEWGRTGLQLKSLWNILTHEAILNENINVMQFSVDLGVNATACCQTYWEVLFALPVDVNLHISLP